jgi:hypothetical protein
MEDGRDVMARLVEETPDLNQVAETLHKCANDCHQPCKKRRQLAVIAALLFEVFCDCLTDIVYYELICDEDCQEFYQEVLCTVWHFNNLDTIEIDEIVTEKNIRIYSSMRQIVKERLEAQPIFLGWTKNSRFFSQPSKHS